MRWRNWLDLAYGFFLGFVCAALLIVKMTDVDTPVANDPKCETIIIHRR
jgi:hypothetical protein